VWVQKGRSVDRSGRSVRESVYKINKYNKKFDSFQNQIKNFSQEDWKVSHTNKVQKLLLF